MSTWNFRLFLFCGLVIAIIPVVYFFYHWSDPQFLDSTMGNWFATMVGVIVGIPIALLINRWQQDAQEKKDREIQKQDETIHKIKILKLVAKELKENLEGFNARQPSADGKERRRVPVTKLKDELWHSFSDGGELQWIKDLELLDYISTAYHHIRNTIYLEERYFDAVHFAGMQVRQKKYQWDYILDYIISTDQMVIVSIGKALDEIDKSLHSTSKY